MGVVRTDQGEGYLVLCAREATLTPVTPVVVVAVLENLPGPALMKLRYCIVAVSVTYMNTDGLCML